MSALEPGLYRATVRGVADVIVLVDRNGTAHHDWTDDEDATSHSFNFTDARPLIVLDLSAFISDAQLVADLRALHVWSATHIAGQIEAQTTPARIPELGLWGVVEATFLNQRTRQPFLRDNIKENVGGGWVAIYGPPGTDKRRVEWDDLIDPTLIREGVTE